MDENLLLHIQIFRFKCHLIILFRFKFFCQRHSELWPLNLSAVVDISHVDDVLHLLLTWVDAAGEKWTTPNNK